MRDAVDLISSQFAKMSAKRTARYHKIRDCSSGSDYGQVKKSYYVFFIFCAEPKTAEIDSCHATWQRSYHAMYKHKYDTRRDHQPNII